MPISLFVGISSEISDETPIKQMLSGNFDAIPTTIPGKYISVTRPFLMF